MCHYTIQCVFLMPIFSGGLGGLTPGVIGVGAAGTLGGAAVVNQMMGPCPATSPCLVRSHLSVYSLGSLFYQVRDPQDPLSMKCCRVIGASRGRLRCPRRC